MNDETRYVINIVISMIPIGIVGLFFKDKVERFSVRVFNRGLYVVSYSSHLHFHTTIDQRKKQYQQKGCTDHRNLASHSSNSRAFTFWDDHCYRLLLGNNKQRWLDSRS